MGGPSALSLNYGVVSALPRKQSHAHTVSNILYDTYHIHMLITHLHKPELISGLWFCHPVSPIAAHSNVCTHAHTHTHTALLSCPSSAYCVKKSLDQGNHSLPSFRLPGRSSYLFKQAMFGAYLESCQFEFQFGSANVVEPKLLSRCDRAKHSPLFVPTSA